MTFQALDEFNEHHLASKKAAYDYIAALRRLTDGAFTPAVAVSGSTGMLTKIADSYLGSLPSICLSYAYMATSLCRQTLWTGTQFESLFSTPNTWFIGQVLLIMSGRGFQHGGRVGEDAGRAQVCTAFLNYHRL